ncbi:DUF572-domain-containing protein [Hesseltinella vesiculosa]|uniref:DUF572-domain-containing protein n=1 Tax=Hesseltinella vesiculosa TaxID=101127 RepID=A0A1X2GBT1_9FUNG|nr:DUF572-domain-containing protein [Hesseltinella vesiculosa]
MQPFNKYYPPDWTPEKGSVNKFVGKHPLGDRARKLDQGILIVRFEMPFNIWCEGCDKHIGRGVRYNAEKKQIGKYYSTAIYQFRMKCHLCNQWIEIHTDPKNTEYVVVSGAKRKVEHWTPDKDDGLVQFTDESVKEKMAEDPFFRLEYGIMDQAAGKSHLPVLTQLQQLNESQWSDPYTQSQRLRRKFRDEKKQLQQAQNDTNKLKDKHSLQIDLVPASEQDSQVAEAIDFSGEQHSKLDDRKRQVATATLFTPLPSHQAAMSLQERALLNTRLKTDPFLQRSSIDSKKRCLDQQASPALVVSKKPKTLSTSQSDTQAKDTKALLVNYSDSDDSE